MCLTQTVMGRVALFSSFSTIFFISFISSSELCGVMSNLGEKLSQEEVRKHGAAGVQTELFTGGGDDEVGRQGWGWDGWLAGVYQHDAGVGEEAFPQLVIDLMVNQCI